MAPKAATSIDAVVVEAGLFYSDGRPGIVLWLSNGRLATMTTMPPDGCQSLPEAIYEHVKPGNHVRLFGRWANVVLTDPAEPYAHHFPAPGRMFVIDQIEREGRPVEQRPYPNSLSWEIEQPWELE